MNDDEFNSWQKKLIAAVIIALAGGNAGFLLNKSTSEVRHDPFTGSEGKEMELRIDRIDTEQQKMIYRMMRREEDSKDCLKTLQEHLRQHP